MEDTKKNKSGATIQLVGKYVKTGWGLYPVLTFVVVKAMMLPEKEEVRKEVLGLLRMAESHANVERALQSR